MRPYLYKVLHVFHLEVPWMWENGFCGWTNLYCTAFAHVETEDDIQDVIVVGQKEQNNNHNMDTMRNRCAPYKGRGR